MADFSADIVKWHTCSPLLLLLLFLFFLLLLLLLMPHSRPFLALCHPPFLLFSGNVASREA